MDRRPVKPVPDPFDGQGILAHQQGPEGRQNDAAFGFPERTANADLPRVRLNLKETRLQMQATRSLLQHVLAGFMLVLGVDVQGADQALFPERPVVFQHAIQLKDAHFGNLHVGATWGKEGLVPARCCGPEVFPIIRRAERWEYLHRERPMPTNLHPWFAP